VQLESRALPPASRALLDGAAVAGDPFDPELAAAAAGLDEAAPATLDRLVAADLVRATGDGLRFRHPLVRRTVYDAAPPGWRRHAHARAAEALAARGAPPVALAHHVERSAPIGDAAAAATLAAAAAASAGSAPATAGRWWTAALRLQPGAEPDQRLRLLLGLAEAEAGAGRHAEAHAALVEAVALLDGQPAALRSEVVAITAAAEHQLGLHEQATRRLRDELELSGPGNRSLAARLRFELAVGALHASDLEALDELAGGSAAELRAAEPALAAADEAIAVVAAAWHGRPAKVPTALAKARSSFAALAREQLAQRPEAAYFLGFAELLTEHVREGIAVAAAGLDAIRAGGQDRMLVPLASLHAMAANAAGDQATALRSGTVAEDAGRLVGPAYGLQWALWVQAMTAHARGDREAWRRLADEAERVMDRVGDVLLTRVGRCNLATLLVADDPARCAAMIERYAGPDLERIDRTWSSFIGVAYVRALLALGREDDASAAAALLERRANELGLPMARARADLARAEVLLAAGDEGAADRARAALDVADERGYGVDAFRAELVLGRALGRQGDRDGRPGRPARRRPAGERRRGLDVARRGGARPAPPRCPRRRRRSCVPATTTSSPTASARSPTSSPRAGRTRRSPPRCSSAARRSSTRSRGSTRSSVCDRAPSSPAPRARLTRPCRAGVADRRLGS
jgi:hypothetical protein